MKQTLRPNRPFKTVEELDFTKPNLGSGPKIPIGSCGMVQRVHRDGTAQVIFNDFGLRRIKIELIENISI